MWSSIKICIFVQKCIGSIWLWKFFFLISQFFLFISSQQDWFFFCFSLFKFVKCNNRFHNKDTPKSYIPSIINIEKKQLLIWPDKNGLVSGRLASTWSIPQILDVITIYIICLNFLGQFEMHFHPKNLKEE